MSMWQSHNLQVYEGNLPNAVGKFPKPSWMVKGEKPLLIVDLVITLFVNMKRRLWPKQKPSYSCLPFALPPTHVLIFALAYLLVFWCVLSVLEISFDYSRSYVCTSTSITSMKRRLQQQHTWMSWINQMNTAAPREWKPSVHCTYWSFTKLSYFPKRIKYTLFVIFWNFYCNVHKLSLEDTALTVNKSMLIIFTFQNAMHLNKQCVIFWVQ